MPLGRDIRRILLDAAAWCDVLLVVIGHRWLGETDAAGRRRWAIRRIGSASRSTRPERDIPVILLLVDGALLAE